MKSKSTSLATIAMKLFIREGAAMGFMDLFGIGSGPGKAIYNVRIFSPMIGQFQVPDTADADAAVKTVLDAYLEVGGGEPFASSIQHAYDSTDFLIDEGDDLELEYDMRGLIDFAMAEEIEGRNSLSNLWVVALVLIFEGKFSVKAKSAGEAIERAKKAFAANEIEMKPYWPDEASLSFIKTQAFRAEYAEEVLGYTFEDDFSQLAMIFPSEG